MAKLGINTGTTPNDNKGDSLIIGAVKINNNFDEIYNYLGAGSTDTLSAPVWQNSDVGISTLKNVGIGTTNPTSSLTVDGNIIVSGIITATSFVGQVSNTLYANISGISTYSEISGLSTVASKVSIGETNLGNNSLVLSSGASLGDNSLYIDSGLYFDAQTNTLTAPNIIGAVSYSLSSGISTLSQYADASGISTYSHNSGISSYSNASGISTYSQVSGISTLSEGLTGTPNIDVGLATIDTINVGPFGTAFSTNQNQYIGIGTANPEYPVQIGSLNQFIIEAINQVNTIGITTTVLSGIDTSSLYEGIQVNSFPDLISVGTRVVSIGSSILVSSASTIGITTDIITGINTEGIEIGFEILEVTNIIQPNTIVASIGNEEITIAPSSLNLSEENNVDLRFGYISPDAVIDRPTLNEVEINTIQLEFGYRDDNRVTCIDENGKIGIGTILLTDKVNINGNVSVSGIVDAVTFVGDGSQLTGVTAVGTGVSIFDSDSIIGVAAAINFGDNLTVSSVSAGIVTVSSTAAGGGESYWASTNVGIHTLSNVGIATTNPQTPLQIENVYGVKTGIGTFNASAGIAHTVDSFLTSEKDFKTSEYTIHIGFGTYIQAQKVLAMQNGTNAYAQEYAIMYEPESIVSITSTIESVQTPTSYDFTVTATDSINYIIAGTDRLGSVSGNDPTITVYEEDTITFDASAVYASHPLYIRDSDGGPSVSNPAAVGEGTESVSWTPSTAGVYYYQCGNHAEMIGTIVVLPRDREFKLYLTPESGISGLTTYRFTRQSML